MPDLTDTPHVVARRLEAAEKNDHGACYIERPDNERVIITVRGPHEGRESKVSIPLHSWLAMIADYQQEPAPSVKVEEVISLDRICELESLFQRDQIDSHRIREMLDALKTLRRYAGDGGVRWQPIESAPKDRPVLLYSAMWGMTWGIVIGEFHGGAWHTSEGEVAPNDPDFDPDAEVDDEDFDFPADANMGPTHWASLPAPPAARAKSSEGKMSELSDWKRCVLPDELASARAQGKAEGIAEVNSALESALSTIAELEKRIGELKVELHESAKQRCDMADTAVREITKIGKLLTAERQRREECEAVLSRYTGTDLPSSGPASEYFSRHPSSSLNEPGAPSDSENRAKVAG